MNTARNNTDVNANLFIPIITGIILWVHFLFLCLPVFALAEETSNGKVNKNNILEKPGGTIDLVIHDGSFSFDEFYEFKIKLTENKIQKTIYSYDEYYKENVEFENNYRKEKLYRNELKQEDFIKWKKLWDLVGEKYKQHYWPKSDDFSYDDLFFEDTRPNRQLSHTIIYNNRGSRAPKAALIDLSTMRIVDYFVNAGECVWDKKGKQFALDIKRDTKENDKTKNIHFMVYSVEAEKEVFRGKLEKDYPDQMAVIPDFAWSRDSRFVAVLAQTSEILYWPPHNFMLFISGHPRTEVKLHLSIFDLAGNLVYSKRIEGKYVGGGQAKMLWLE